MQYAPGGYVPGLTTIYNGRATEATDAIEVDRYSAWLAAVKKWPVPYQIGTPFDATNTATPCPVHVWVPAYTAAVAAELLCTGQGTVTLTNGDDAFNAVIDCYAYDGGTHAFANAVVVPCGPPQTGVAANGLDRALNVTVAAAPRYVAFTLKVANDGAKTLRVWGVRLLPLPLPAATVMPA